MEAELQRLNNTLPQIQEVVEEAERGEQIVPEHLKVWLQQLKDALCEADDVVDELEYRRLKEQVEVCGSFSRTLKNKANKFKGRISDPILNELRGVVSKLDGMAAQVGAFLASLALASGAEQRHDRAKARCETSPLRTENMIVGRENEKERLLQWLVKSADEDDDDASVASLFSIVGHAGMGKTALARLVFDDETVRGSYDPIWVSVSPSFDIKRLTAAMLEYVTNTSAAVHSLPALQDALKKKLMSSRKFLLILDNAWNDDNPSDWNKLFAPLKYGHKGSKVLLTTRLNQVAEMASQALGGRKESMKLVGLPHDEFWSLFSQYAFARLDSCHLERLKPIGMQIATRLGGSPLAAKTIGTLLMEDSTDKHWCNILRSNIVHEMQQTEQKIMSNLMLSYHHLPLHLKPCFAFSGMFPRDHVFCKADLVRMWVSLGFVQPRPGNKREILEDIGSGYFDDLVKRSLFKQRQEAEEEGEAEEEYYVMDDLLHDLAECVSRGECFRFESGLSVEDIPATVRHLFFVATDPSLLEKVHKWSNLRTLVLTVKGNLCEQTMFFETLFASLETIRILQITSDGMIKLPQAIEKLRHLRILSVRSIGDNKISQLPKSICKLYHLQCIYLYGTNVEFDLPKGINDLISLRHIVPKHTMYKIKGIRKLSSLQDVWFDVDQENGHALEELRDLRNLRELNIRGLENVRSHREASMAELHNKHHLLNLELAWQRRSKCVGDLIEHEKIIDCLQPSSGVRRLTIDGYEGVRSAKWMECEMIDNLNYIRLENCSGWQQLPSLGKLRHLKYLHLREMSEVKKVDCEGGFPRLEILEIHGLEQFEDWCCSGEEVNEWCPHLRALRIKSCHKLKGLPSLPFSLKSLLLEEVGLIKHPTLQSSTNISSSSSSRSARSLSSSSLSLLTIYRCKRLKSVSGLLLHDLKSLKRLEIVDCADLIEFPEAGLQHLHALEILLIGDCPELQLGSYNITHDSFLLPSLQVVSFSNAGDMVMLLPTLLQSALTSLSKLVLNWCKDMTSLPAANVFGRMSSLRQLHLQDCLELACIDGLRSLRHLDCLSIDNCPKLVRVAETATVAEMSAKEENFMLVVIELAIDDPLLLRTEPLRSLTSVRRVKISRCSTLCSMEDGLEQWLLQNCTTLEELCLSDVRSLEYLTRKIQDLSSLKHLRLDQAYKLWSIPQLPSSLQTLKIDGSSESLKQRCRRGTGADWCHIEHVANISIQQIATAEFKILLACPLSRKVW